MSKDDQAAAGWVRQRGAHRRKETPMTNTTVDPKSLPVSDPKRHSMQTRTKLSGLAEHLREDAGKVDDPRAKALFETAAEVLLGLEHAFADYEQGEEEAWQ
jgi:hypothetical protein